MTLTDVLNDLKIKNSDAPLIFFTDDARIGGGYHVTELKSAKVTSIDCGGTMSEWTEAALQLLDGHQGSHMEVGKFIGILEHSLRSIETLRNAPVHVEFSPGNQGLRRFEIEFVNTDADRAEVRLSEARATCKPAALGTCGPGCGEASAEKGSCCG